MKNQKIVYVVGKVITEIKNGKYVDTGQWEIMGIYSTRKKAIKSIRQTKYNYKNPECIMPTVMDMTFSDEIMSHDCTWYPKLEKEKFCTDSEIIKTMRKR